MTLHLAGVGADRDTKEVRVVFVKYDPVAERRRVTNGSKSCSVLVPQSRR
jgi:hypothetical protein